MKAIKSLAAAAIAVASFVPMASVSATSGFAQIGDTANTISSIDVSIIPPTAGTTITEGACPGESESSESVCLQPRPTITTTSTAYTAYADYVKCIPETLEGEEMAACYDRLEAGTQFVAGSDYYVRISLFTDFINGPFFDVEWDEETAQQITNVTANVSGAKSFKIQRVGMYDCDIFATVTATGSSSSSDSSESTTSTNVYQTLDGGDQTFYTASDSNLTFRFNIDYDEFQDSGEVYMDGEIVNSTNYTTKSGSTIITFTDSYTNSLSAGSHTMRVVTANGEASTNFTISKSANPKTGLEITSNFVLLGTSLAGLAGAALYAKKASKNA